MEERKLLIGSHAPFWHNGSSIREKSLHTGLAALPAVLMGIYQYGVPTLGVIALSISFAMIWELLMNRVMGRPLSIIDWNAGLIGLLFSMLMPASIPWWAVVLGTFVAVVVGKQIFGGIGCNPLHPVLVAIATMVLSWKDVLDFNQALVSFDLGFNMVYPLSAAKAFGSSAVENYTTLGLLLGRQAGGLGATFGLGIIIGGIYLILRGYIRWEIPLSFLVGVFVTALLFNLSNPDRYAGPFFHLLTGYTLIMAFFFLPEDSSSPVNLVPMLIYGAIAGFLTVLVRNVGAFADGAVFAVLLMNIANPIIDKIRPKALGRSVEHA